jgi:hypothetical protein
MHFHHDIKILKTYLKEGMQMYYHNINHTIMNGITKNIPPFESIYIFLKMSWQTMNENLAKKSYNIQNHLHAHYYFLWRCNFQFQI